MTANRELDYYLSLPYTFEIVQEQDGVWFAKVRELPGCMTEGDTLEDATAMLKDALVAWLEVAVRDGYPIPEPKAVDDYSGKFNLRIPKTLHRQLTEAASREGVSLNQYINAELARSIGESAAQQHAGTNRR